MALFIPAIPESPLLQIPVGSSYGVATALIYPPDTRRVHLAFFASSLENNPAEKAFLAGLDTERRTLQSIPFWP